MSAAPQQEPHAHLAELIREAVSVVATGAGISVPSGIPDFRSPGTGVWANVDPMEVAHIQATRSSPTSCRSARTCRSRRAQESQLDRTADLMLCIGTSLEVYPISELPSLTRSEGGQVAVITKSPTDSGRRGRQARRRPG